MYPCCRPSESLAFRTNLAKYLVQLRHHSIHSLRSSSNSAGGDSGSPAAPWWGDVTVRKSILEESAGEKCVYDVVHSLYHSIVKYYHRFDRLMLSLSTHALMKASNVIPQEMTAVCMFTFLNMSTTSNNALLGTPPVGANFIRK